MRMATRAMKRTRKSGRIRKEINVSSRVSTPTELKPWAAVSFMGPLKTQVKAEASRMPIQLRKLAAASTLTPFFRRRAELDEGPATAG